MIDVLAADDEAPALAELAHLLRADPRVGEIVTASSGADALRRMSVRPVDAAFLDIHMPGLDGIALVAAMHRLMVPPAVVFVTADDSRAVDAFEVRAVDYLLKPVRAQRLRGALDRIVELRSTAPDDEVVPVTLGSSVRFVRRRDVQWVHAEGDYSRLHTDDGAHLVRLPISELDERWAPHGFVRVHRSYLVRIAAITEARLTGGEPVVVVADAPPLSIPVSRRMLPAVRESLVRTREAGR